MRSVSLKFVLLSCLLAAGGIVNAEEPSTTAAPAETAAAAPSAETSKPAEALSEEDKDDNLRRAEFERVSKQYKKTEKDGETFYCRSEKQLGTRLPKMVCLTEGQLWTRIDNAEETRKEMRARRGNDCRTTGGGSC